MGNNASSIDTGKSLVEDIKKPNEKVELDSETLMQLINTEWEGSKENAPKALHRLFVRMGRQYKLPRGTQVYSKTITSIDNAIKSSNDNNKKGYLVTVKDHLKKINNIAPLKGKKIKKVVESVGKEHADKQKKLDESASIDATTFLLQIESMYDLLKTQGVDTVEQFKTHENLSELLQLYNPNLSGAAKDLVIKKLFDEYNSKDNPVEFTDKHNELLSKLMDDRNKGITAGGYKKRKYKKKYRKKRKYTKRNTKKNKSALRKYKTRQSKKSKFKKHKYTSRRSRK